MKRSNEDQRKRPNIETMTQEELDRNWEEAERQMARLSKKEFKSKFVDKVPVYRIKAVPRLPSHQRRLCLFCDRDACGTADCTLPRGLTAMDLISSGCGVNQCTDRGADGECPAVCPRFVLDWEFQFYDETVAWGLIERLVAEGIDLKTWTPDEADKFRIDP